MITIENKHFRLIEDALNERCGEDLFKIVGEPEKDQKEMFGYVNNWIIADNIYRARLRGLNNYIMINFSDLNYFNKLNFKTEEILTKKNEICESIEKNAELLNINNYNWLEKEKLNFPLKMIMFTINDSIFFDLTDNKLYHNYKLRIDADDKETTVYFKRVHNNIETIKDDIDFFFKDVFYRNIVNKKYNDLTNEDKDLIRLFYYE